MLQVQAESSHFFPFKKFCTGRAKKFIIRFSGCFPEGKKEGRKGGEEGREGVREGGGRKWRHVRIMNDVLSENDPLWAK